MKVPPPPSETDDIEIARQIWVRITQSIRKSLTSTGWNHPIRNAQDNSQQRAMERFVGRIAPAAERLKKVSLENRPAQEIIDIYGGDPDTVLYVDPPYVGTSGYQGKFTEQDHIDLLEQLKKCDATVMLSGYPSPIYTEHLAGWNTLQKKSIVATRPGNIRPHQRTEIIWSNRPLGNQPTLFGHGT